MENTLPISLMTKALVNKLPPSTIPRPEHPISRKAIDSDALKVLYRLYRAGHTAYLVGGGVRDLLLKRNPKDFDIVTSARPSQIKKLFRNCRLIGRRFRLAHIHFLGGKIIELSTFRAEPDLGLDSEDLLVRDDNTFGSPRQDALRRDFTINSLFYDISTFSLIDYVGGLEDVHRGIIRTIGDPRLRFQEDPVRMIRAIKFAARLGFKIEAKTWKAMVELAPSIGKSPKPRVHEELARLLEEGSAARSIQLLDEAGLLEFLEPNLEAYLRLAERGRVGHDRDGRLIAHLLEAADEEFRRTGKKLPRPLLFGLWTFPLLLDQGLMETENPDALVRDGAGTMLSRLGLPRRDIERVQQLLLAQRRIFPRNKKRKRSLPKGLAGKAYFQESLALFKLWVRATGEGHDELERWSDVLDTPPEPDYVARDLPPRRDADASSNGGDNRRRRLRRRRSHEHGVG